MFVRIWQKLRSNASGCVQSARRGLRLRSLLVVLLLVLALLGAMTTPTRCDEPSSPASVELSVSEAESLITLIDDLEIERWRLEQKAVIDSLYYEDRLARQEKLYEEIIESYKGERPGWLERLVKQPVVWLAIGMWVGVQAN